MELKKQICTEKIAKVAMNLDEKIITPADHFTQKRKGRRSYN